MAMARHRGRAGACVAAAFLLLLAAGCETEVEDGPDDADTSSSGSGGSSASNASSGSGQQCAPECGDKGLTCCPGSDACVNFFSDLLNCGGCGVVCPSSEPWCHDGNCAPLPCSPGLEPCESQTFCCGDQCCGAGQICCDVPDALGPVPACVDVTEHGGTCPPGCPLCNG